VRDDDNKLLGVVDARQLPTLAQDAQLLDVHAPVALVLRTDDPTEELLRQFTVADVGLVPVLDERGRLAGVVRPRDAMKLLNKRLEQALAASDTGITSYSKASWHLLVRKRIFWLLVLAMLNFGVAAVVAQFEETISANLVLAGFIPLLAGMGGNIGAQSSGLVIAAVSGRDIAPKDIWRVMRKEVVVGAALSAILAGIVAVMGFIRANQGSKGEIAATLGVSMGVIALVSNLLGVLFPFAALRFGQDPAVSSSPLITTVIDVAGISIYLGLARVILKM
jgi:magnesium transporter